MICENGTGSERDGRRWNRDWGNLRSTRIAEDTVGTSASWATTGNDREVGLRIARAERWISRRGLDKDEFFFLSAIATAVVQIIPIEAIYSVG